MTVKTLQGRLSAAPQNGKVFCFIGKKMFPIETAFTANKDIIINLDMSDEDLYDAARENWFSQQEP
jgi:hypothetical protein